MKGLLVVAIAAVALAGCGAAHHQLSVGKVEVVPSSAIAEKGVTRPKSFGLSADGSGYLTHIVWSSWGGPDATGRAVLEQNSCDPSCGGGTYTSYPGTVVLSSVEPCPGSPRDFYMALTYIPAAGETAKTSTYSLNCPES